MREGEGASTLSATTAPETSPTGEMDSTSFAEFQSSMCTPAGKRRKVSVESMDGDYSTFLLVESKLGSMPEGQEALRKRKRYLA